MPIAEEDGAKGAVSEGFDGCVGAMRAWRGVGEGRGGAGRDILVRASPTWSLPFWIDTAGMPRTLTVSLAVFFVLAVLCMALFEGVNMIRRASPGRTRKT
jgi:hypothetical protein